MVYYIYTQKNWVLGLGIGLDIHTPKQTQNPKICKPKLKTLTQNLNPKPKNIYTQTQQFFR